MDSRVANVLFDKAVERHPGRQPVADRRLHVGLSQGPVLTVISGDFGK